MRPPRTDRRNGHVTSTDIRRSRRGGKTTVTPRRLVFVGSSVSKLGSKLAGELSNTCTKAWISTLAPQTACNRHMNGEFAGNDSNVLAKTPMAVRAPPTVVYSDAVQIFMPSQKRNNTLPRPKALAKRTDTQLVTQASAAKIRTESLEHRCVPPCTCNP